MSFTRTFRTLALRLAPGDRLLNDGEEIGAVHSFLHPAGFRLTEVTMRYTERTLTFESAVEVIAW
jgi:hypothetical protein